MRNCFEKEFRKTIIFRRKLMYADDCENCLSKHCVVVVHRVLRLRRSGVHAGGPSAAGGGALRRSYGARSCCRPRQRSRRGRVDIDVDIGVVIYLDIDVDTNGDTNVDTDGATPRAPAVHVSPSMSP